MAAFEVKDSFATPKVKLKTDTKAERARALKALTRGVMQGGSTIEAYLPPLLEKALDASVWSWPRQTLRKNGSLASTTRSITDTGALKGNGKVTTKYLKTKTIFSVKYTSPYAGLVHNGGYIVPYGDMSRQKVYVPGRPWIEAVLQGNVPGIEYLDTSDLMEEAISSAWESS